MPKNKNIIKNFRKLANQITLLRILLLPFMYYLAYYSNKQAFTLLFIIAGITDPIDGYVARRFKQASKFGVKLDSFADYLIYLSLVPWLYFLEKDFFADKVWWIVILISLFLLLQAVNLLRHREFIAMHTSLGKVTAVMLYIVVINGLLRGFTTLVFYSIYSLGVLAVLESLIMALKKKA